MVAPKFKYDVAFSFLARSRGNSGLIALLQSILYCIVTPLVFASIARRSSDYMLGLYALLVVAVVLLNIAVVRELIVNGWI